MITHGLAQTASIRLLAVAEEMRAAFGLIGASRQTPFHVRRKDFLRIHSHVFLIHLLSSELVDPRTASCHQNSCQAYHSPSVLLKVQQS